MIPAGNAFLKMRADLLATFPESARAPISFRQSLVEWLGNGSFLISASSGAGFTLEAAEDDMASVLLCEVELLLNHCLEHIQEVACFSDDNRIRSDAWNIVTIYYLGFFATQVFLRMVGLPVIFLDKQLVRDLKAIGGVTSKAGAGAYTLRKGTQIGVNRCEYILSRRDDTVHDATWKILFAYCNGLKKIAKINDNEGILYALMASGALEKAYGARAWPLKVRGLANYHAGFAYRLVEGTIVGKTRGLQAVWRSLASGTDLTDQLRSSLAQCVEKVDGQFDKHVQVMNDLTYTVYMLCRSLYGELRMRRRLDARWEAGRRHFRKRMVLKSDECPWILG